MILFYSRQVIEISKTMSPWRAQKYFMVVKKSVYNSRLMCELSLCCLKAQVLKDENVLLFGKKIYITLIYV